MKNNEWCQGDKVTFVKQQVRDVCSGLREVKTLENIVKIIETQEESEKDDEILFTLFVDGKPMSWAKTILYSNLDDIHTACLEKRKGYGRLLLAFIEKNAQNHCATLIRTSNFDACNDEATNFFKKMFYEINPSITKLNAPVRAIKFFKSCR